jgi:hypothetical protein
VKLALVLICFFLGVVSGSHANLVINGSFESPGAALTTDYTAINTNTLPGWTSTVGNGTGPANYLSATNSTADWIPNPQSGNYCVQLDSSTMPDLYTIGGAVSQTISLTANTQYQLTFYMSAEVKTLNSSNQPVSCTSQLNVLLNGGGFSNQNMVNPATGTTGFLATWDGSPKATPELSWVKWTLLFTPTASGNVTITFQDVWVNNPASSNAALDNVDLVVVSERMPLAVIVSFLLTVITTNFFAIRRKRAKQSPTNRTRPRIRRSLRLFLDAASHSCVK